jgi:DNA-binding YbaB/EbfC family protein
MADMFKMMKQAVAMRQQMKRIEKELCKHVAEASSGDVTVVARGDMTIQSVRIAPEALADSRPERLERMVVAAVNNALAVAKKQAGAEMAKLGGGLGGLSEMLGMGG